MRWIAVNDDIATLHGNSSRVRARKRREDKGRRATNPSDVIARTSSWLVPSTVRSINKAPPPPLVTTLLSNEHAVTLTAPSLRQITTRILVQSDRQRAKVIPNRTIPSDDGKAMNESDQ